MALYAIGDLHLSTGTNKPMDVFGGRWQNYREKLADGLAVLKEGDTLVLCGDTSWGMTLEEALPDFEYLQSLPGRKLILKGNHDYWWSTANKIHSFFQTHNLTSLDILHNNAFFYGDIAICGSRGWFYEEAVHGGEHDKKIMNREVQRVVTSLKAGEGKAVKKVFLHYPPLFNQFVCRDLIQVLKDFGVEDCYYGHLHGEGHKYAITGEVDGIHYHMLSADFVNFRPLCLTTEPDPGSR
ncbi:MAG: metallophosphoesterase [Oscillospiraceae bacterium]|nr:metallophosphoesterase [Oscillospiraceae bacterium]